MNIEEAKVKFRDAIKNATEEFCSDVKAILREHKLDNKVRDKRDLRIGWLKLATDYYLNYYLNFYPMKKDGTCSLKASGWVNDSEISDRFEPYEEDAE